MYRIVYFLNCSVINSFNDIYTDRLIFDNLNFCSLTKKSQWYTTEYHPISLCSIGPFNGISVGLSGTVNGRVTWGSPAPLRERLFFFVSITCRCIIVH